MYPTDVSDEQWLLIEDLFCQRDPRGRKPWHEPRVMFNAILYLVRSGCQWRMLPMLICTHIEPNRLRHNRATLIAG